MEQNMSGNIDAVQAVHLHRRLPMPVVRHIIHKPAGGKWRAVLPLNRFIYIFSGGKSSSSITVGEKRFDMLPCHWLFIPAGAESCHEQSESLELISVHFNMELFPGVEAFLGMKESFCGAAPQWENALRSLLSPDVGTAGVIQLQSILWQMTAGISLSTPIPRMTDYERFARFSGLFEKFSADSGHNYSVEEMAEFMNMGKESFVKHFRDETGVSPKKFFNSCRAAAAAKELLHSRKSLQEISEEYGFTNVFYFSRFFKRFYRQSPTEYRKNSKLQ